jgi:hypothetical protein
MRIAAVVSGAARRRGGGAARKNCQKIARVGGQSKCNL